MSPQPPLHETLRKAVDLVERGKRGRWALLVALAVSIAVFESVATVLIFAVMQAVTEPEHRLVVPLLGDLQQRFPDTSSADLFVRAALVLVVFFLARAVASVFQTYAQNRVAQRSGVHLALRLLRGYLRMPYAFHLRRNSAESIRNATESINSIVSYIFVTVVVVASEALIVVGIIGVLLAKAPLVTVLGMGLLGVLVATVLRFVQPRLADFGVTSQNALRESIQDMQQTLQGIRDVTLLGVESSFESRFERSRAALARAKYLRATYSDLTKVTVETAVIVFVLAFLAIHISGNPETSDSLAVLGLFAYAVLRVLPSLNKILNNINYFGFGTAAVEDVHADLARFAAASEAERDERIAEPFDEAIELDEVTFTYEGATEPAVRDVTLRIDAGQMVGIVGQTGSGKTTLVDLILGLLGPTAGTVRIDGHDLRSCRRWWQEQIGVVSQAVFLLDDTLRENITFGADRDDEAIARAVELAQLGTVVHGLAQGLDTEVGERGVRLSGGERQRVAIARALYLDPPVLVFDEGTAALDTATESSLIRDLSALRDGRTIISIAHRLSTVRDCDTIYFMQRGRLLHHGSFDQLFEESADFRALAR